MPKYVAKLAAAEHHPGVAVLRRIDTGETLLQLPAAQAYEMMGKRREVFYVVSIRAGAYHLDNEVPPEKVDEIQAKLLGTKPVSGQPGTPPALEGS